MRPHYIPNLGTGELARQRAKKPGTMVPGFLRIKSNFEPVRRPTGNRNY